MICFMFFEQMLIDPPSPWIPWGWLDGDPRFLDPPWPSVVHCPGLSNGELVGSAALLNHWDPMVSPITHRIHVLHGNMDPIHIPQSCYHIIILYTSTMDPMGHGCIDYPDIAKGSTHHGIAVDLWTEKSEMLEVSDQSQECTKTCGSL